ncbi:MAG: efflux RND transporter periplasmic adaptor subunit [Labilithrix sp.]|nr:efflux RND transporter periplasmic adaptor subunit [Labilithrix sp.]MCW5834379.1 efflux RND transporter periplasmic adaptor subunit [Labilithrix sp.]
MAIFVFAGVTIVALAFLFGWLPKRRARQELEASTKELAAAVPRVEVVKPKVLSSDRSLVLPGTVSPLEEAAIRTRASGYVRRRLVDIGDKVEAGALLVEIDTPELDQQLEQARAQLAQAQAALTHARASSEYSRSSLARREKLAPTGVTSADEVEKSRSEAAVAEASVALAQANVDAQGANVRRLTQEKAFARVVAPFAGTVIARSVDKGALVNPSVELLKIATTDPMRVLIEVPQDVAPSVQNDVPAAVTVREFAGRTFEGKVARFASALDARSRTMTTVVHVPNPKGELLAGMYARVEITLPLPHRVLEVPSTALIADAHGTRVAIVGADGRIRLVPIVIERDTGPTIQVATGIDEHDRVVRIGGADLVDGRQVELAEKEK